MRLDKTSGRANVAGDKRSWPELKSRRRTGHGERHPDGALGTGRVLSRRRRTCHCAQTLHKSREFRTTTHRILEMC